MAKKRRNPVTLAERWRKSLAAKRGAQDSQRERKEWLQSWEGREARQEALFAANRLAEQLGIDPSEGYKKSMGGMRTIEVSPEDMKRAAQSAVNYHDIMCRTQLLESSAMTQGLGKETVPRVPGIGGTRLGQGAVPQFLDVRLGPVVTAAPGANGGAKEGYTTVEMFLPMGVLVGSPIGATAVTWEDNTSITDERHAVGADWYTIPKAEAGQNIYLTVVPPDGKLVAAFFDNWDGKVYCSWGTPDRWPVNIVGRPWKPAPKLEDVKYEYDEEWDEEKKEEITKLFETKWKRGEIVHSVLLAAYDEGLGRYIRTPGDPSDRLSWKPCLTEYSGGVAAPPVAWDISRRTVVTTDDNGEETETTKWQVFHPAWHAGRKVFYAGGVVGGWNDLPSNLTYRGVIYAVLKEVGENDYDSDTDEVRSTTWTVSEVFIANSSQIPEDSRPYRTDKGYRYRTVALGQFVTVDGVLTWEQWHVGAIVEKPTAEGGSGGGEGLPDGTLIPGDLRITNSGGAVWLQQRKRIWRESEGAFEDAGDGYAVNVLRLDEALTAAVLTESRETGNVNKKIVRRKLDWSQVTADTGTTIAPGIDAATTPKDGDAEVAKFEQFKLLETDGENLRYFNAYVLAPGDVTQWLSQQTVDFTVTVGYTEPADQYSKGKLFHRPGTITVLGTEVSEGANETLLETVVEEANDTSTYES